MVTSHAFSLYIRILQDFSRLAQIISNYIYSYIIGFNSLDNSPEAGLLCANEKKTMHEI